MTFKSALKSEWLFLLILITAAIFIRSLNFTGSLNFSTDQARFSIKALEILRGENESFQLIGPPISLQLEGREIYQGGVIYYFQALFLFLGNLDPVTSSGIFMVFACLMAVPLYFGVRLLTDSGKAKFLVVLYCLAPLFINYTKFFWNPNFQLALLPVLILLLGLFKKTQKSYWLLIAGVWFGVILQLHYQLFIGGLFLLVYLKYFLKVSLGRILLFITGAIAGFLPMIIYEIKHNFSNLETLVFYLENFSRFSQSNTGRGFFSNQHYFLSLILFILLFAFSAIKNLSSKVFYFTAVLLLVVDMFLYIPVPARGFGMAENWNYSKEEEVFKIIKERDGQYNITNLNYDTLATVQKYLHKKDNMGENLIDYWETERVFVIAPRKKDIYNDLTYEVQVVKPFKVIEEWNIGTEHILYLLEKV